MCEQKHKHYECIVAWASGKKIQWRNTSLNQWEDASTPSWNDRNQYRIKPEPKPDVVLYSQMNVTKGVASTRGWKNFDDNVQFTFDGETGKLKSVEKINCAE